MPDVGTLSLTIESNASTTAGGLKELADALERVQRVVGTELKLSNVAKPLNELTRKIEDSKSLANMGTFLNAISTYSKEFKKVAGKTGDIKINTKPIEQIKEALEGGIHIGQAGTQISKLREALGGEWDTENAKNAAEALKVIAEGSKTINASSLSTTVKNISGLADSLSKYADSFAKMNNTTGAHDYLGMQVFATVDASKAKGIGDNVAKSISDGIKENKNTIAESITTTTRDALEEAARSAKSAYNGWDYARLMTTYTSDPTLGSGGGKRGTKFSEGQIAMDLDGTAERIKEVVQGMNVTDAAVSKVVDKTAEVKNNFNSIKIAENIATPVEALSDVMRNAAENTQRYRNEVEILMPKISELSAAGAIEALNMRASSMSKRELQAWVRELKASIDVVDNADVSPDIVPVESVTQFNIQLQETGDTLTSVVIPAFREMYEIWSKMAYEFGSFGSSALRLEAGEDIHRAVDDAKMLSTYVKPFFTKEGFESWTPGWTMEDPMKDTYQRMVDMYNEFGYFRQAGPLLGSGEEPLRLYGEVGSAQEVESAVDGMRTAARVIEDTDRAAKDAKVSLDDYYASLNKIDLLKQLREVLTGELAQGMFSGKFDDKQIINYELKIKNLTDQIEKLEDAERRASDEAVNMAKEKISEFMEYDQIELATRKYDEMTDALARRYSAGKMTEAQFVEEIKKLQAMRDKLEELKEAEANASSFNGVMTRAFHAFGKGLKNMFPTLSGMIGRFAQIAKYRMLRSVLRHITSGFTEGVKNVYQYSKAVGTSLAPAMDQAATALQQMKNSLGAATAPLIQALVPVLQNVVNAFISAINWANQFFALLRGQSTWTRALPEAAEAYEKSTKAAKGTSKAMKDLLADWDELNIIQSQTGSGGGSGTGKNSEEYKNMFEEVNQFSDSVKNALDFFNDTFGGLPGLLKKAGAIIIGWKLSRAFEGFLGLLGKLIAGTALVITGIELSFGGGYSAGSKGYFDTTDIIMSVLGGIASAIGGSLITTSLGLGGAAGFAIGLTVAVVATLIGWVKGQKDLEDKNKWGNLSMTRDEIESFVKKQFTFDVTASVNVLSGVIKNNEDAQRDLNTKIDNFKNSLHDATVQAGISIDSSETGKAVSDAYKDAQEAIKSVENLMKVNNDGLSILIKTFKLENAGGEDITTDLMESISKADETTKAYFTDIGKQLAKWISEGERNGYTEDITRNALALMEREKKILEKAQQYTEEYDFQNKLKSSMDKVVDRDTARQQMEVQEQLLSEYKEKAAQALETQRNTALELAGLAQGAADDALEQAKKAQQAGNTEQYNYFMEQYKGLTEAAETYKKEAESALNAMDNIEDQLKETKANMAKQWAETLKTVYGEDFKNIVNYRTEDEVHSGLLWKWVSDQLGLEYNSENKNEIQKAIKEGGVTKYADTLKENIITALTDSWNDPNGVVKNYFEKLNGSLFDLLTEDAKQTLLQNLYDLTGDLGTASDIFQQVLGIDTFGTLEQYVANVNLKPEVNVVDSPVNENMSDEAICDKLGLGFLRYNPPEMEVPVNVTTDISVDATVEQEVTDKVKEAVPEEVHVEINPFLSTTWDGFTFDDSTLQGIYKHLNWQLADAGFEGGNRAGYQKIIESLKSAENLDVMLKLSKAIDEYGVVEAFKKLNEINVNPDGTLGKTRQVGVVAAVGNVSDVSYRHGTGSETSGQGETAVINYDQMTTSVATGARTANTDVVSELRTVASYLLRLLNKDWTINVSPNSDWGGHNAKSEEAYGNVWGD